LKESENFMYPFFDIHTHCLEYDKKGYRIVNLDFKQAKQILAENNNEFFSTGFHPCFLENFSESNFEKLKFLANDNRVKAIGECGLDKNSNFDLKTQIFAFEKQIYLSEETEKPLVIHCVGKINELLEIKNTLKPVQLWIIHGFRGKPQLAEQILKAGCALSFAEFFNTESLKITPFNKLFVETDESAKPIEEIYFNIAKIKNCKIEDLDAGKRLFENFL